MAAPVYIEKAVAAALKASPDVSALCSGRVYPLKIPQGKKLPAVVYQRTHSSPDYTLSGYTSEGVVIMVNCFALHYEAAKELALAVRGAMADAPLNAIFESELDVLNETGDVYCIHAEYRCRQTGGYCSCFNPRP
jgi:hypothetical protein